MASAVSSISNAVLAICRLVEETSGHETFKHLGPACLAKFESTQFLYSVGTPNSNYFLVASNQVLRKGLLKAALEKQDQEIRHKKRKPPVYNIVAEFPGIKDRGKLERKPLSELYRSLEDDVFELNGIIYVALTKLEPRRFSIKSSLISRALEAIDTEKRNGSSVLTSDQLQCLVFCGEGTASTREDRNICELSTRVYDLLQCDSVLANDESRFPSYFLRNDENKRFLEEGEFAKDEKPLGAIIVNKDCKLAGVLNFINKHPSLVIVGSALDTAGERHNETKREMLVGASGGIYPLLDPQSKSEVGTEAAMRAFNLPQPATTASTGNPYVAGLNMTDGQKGEDKSADRGATYQPQLPIVNGEKGLQKRKDQDFTKETSSPTENSCRSLNFNSCNQTDLDGKGVVTLVNLPPENGAKEEPVPVACPAGELSGHQPNTQGAHGKIIGPQDRSMDPSPQGPADELSHQTNIQGAHGSTIVPQDRSTDHSPQGPADELSSHQTNTQGAHGNTIAPQDRSRDHSPQGPDSDRRHSIPPYPPPKVEHPQVTRSFSGASKHPPAEEKRKFQLSNGQF